MCQVAPVSLLYLIREEDAELHVRYQNITITFFSGPRNDDSFPFTLVNVESWQDVSENLLIAMACIVILVV